jgi:NitT/TauT family transport system substrate-binding protein
MRRIFILCLLGLVIFVLLGGCAAKEEKSISLAVEFVDHAAPAYIAENKGWFEEAGLKIKAFDNYMTGTALAAALGRGDVDAAYICLIPAINAYANGKVPIKIVAGTHKYGYGVIVDPDKIKNVRDLEKPGIRIGCPSEGSVVDVLLNKTIDKYALDRDKILNKVRRMPPPKILLALQAGQLDVAFLPEQYPTIGEEMGFKELLSARDLWPEMQGSVLIVREELIMNNPEIVKKLVEVTRRGVEYVDKHPKDAAVIVAEELTVSGKEIFPLEVAKSAGKLEVTPEVILKSLTTKMECTAELDQDMVQDEIDYLAQLGYIERFNARDILDVRFNESN